MIRIESDNMKKITIVFSLVAVASMSIFASEISQELKPSHFQKASQLVADLQRNLEAEVFTKSDLNKVHRLGVFYGHPHLFGLCQGSQKGQCKADVSDFVQLAEAVGRKFGPYCVLGIPLVRNKRDREVAEGRIPALCCPPLQRPVSPFSDAEMFGMGLPPEDMAPEDASMGLLK